VLVGARSVWRSRTYLIVNLVKDFAQGARKGRTYAAKNLECFHANISDNRESDPTKSSNYFLRTIYTCKRVRQMRLIDCKIIGVGNHKLIIGACSFDAISGLNLLVSCGQLSTKSLLSLH
jgi:hypothetical protein